MAEKLGMMILKSGGKLLWIGLLGLVAVQPLLKPAMTCSDDGGHYLVRFVELDHCLRQGAPWPRWTPDLVYGYGYPLFNFFPPLSFYPAEFFHLLGLSFAYAWNAALALYILLAGMTMYLLVKDVFGEKSAWVAAVAYMYAPYQLYNALYRGNLGESMALPLLPLILWAFRRLLARGRICYLILSALSYATLILTHNVISLIFTPVLLLYVGVWWLLKKRTLRSLSLISAALLLALGFSAFFWLPAFLDKQWVKIHLAYTPAGMNYHYNFLSLGELLSPPTPIHTSLMNPTPPRGLGLVQLALALLAMAGWWGFKGREKRFTVLLFSFVLISLTFMVLPQSVAVWDHLPLLEYVQFPFRFLGIASLTAALLAGGLFGISGGQGIGFPNSLGVTRKEPEQVRDSAIPQGLPNPRLRFTFYVSRFTFYVSRFTKRPPFIILGVLVVQLLIIAFSLPWLYPRYCSTTEGLSIARLARLERSLGVIGATSAGEYLPIWVKEVPSGSNMEAMYRAGAPIERLEPSSLPGGAVIKSAEYGLTSADIHIESPQPFRAVFNTFYFPGWRVYVDRNEVSIVPTEPYGLISFEVPAGESNLQVRFQDTPLRLAAKALSALSALVVLGLVVCGLKIGYWRSGIGGLAEGNAIRNTQYAIRDPLWILQATLAIALLVVKVNYIDRHDNWFRRRGFDGSRVEGVQVPLEVNFGGEMTLLGYDLRSSTVEAGETFRLDLYWKAQRKLDADYSAYARLKDAQSNLWSPKDSRRPGGYRDYPPTTTWPLDQYAQDSYQIVVLPGTQPGEYDLVVGVFSKATLEELDVLDEQGVAVGASLAISELTVVRPRKPPSVVELEIQHPVAIRFGEELELRGYDIGRPAAQAGEGVHLTLFWRSLKEMNQAYAVLLQLRDEGGGVASEETFPVAGESYPTTQWQAGEVVRSQHYFPVPAKTSAGRHCLQLTVIDQEGVPLAAAVDLSELEVEVPERRMTLPAVANPMEINLGDEATFLGYDLSATEFKPGDTLRLTLYWQARREIAVWYKVFTHLLDDEDRIWAQKDSVPVGGMRPTTGWVRGEVIVDEYELAVDPDAPGGDYILEVGMYEEGTGQRLRVLDEEGQVVGDRILLGKVRVGPDS